MEVRIPQPKEIEGPGDASVAGQQTDAPAPPLVPRDADEDVAPVPLSSGEETTSSDEGEFEFEFPFVSRDSPAGTAAPADELFADGRIRPFYPVFGRGVGVGGCVHAAGIHDGTSRSAPAAAPRVRGQLGRLFLEETRARNSSTSSTESSASSAAADDDRDGLEGAAPESYCVWRPGSGSSAPASPSPRRPRKSGSTGSLARWRRISDLVVGRSHSDGKEKYLFFATPKHEAPNKDKPKTKATPPAGRKPTPNTAEVDMVRVTAAHRIAYLAKSGGTGGGGGSAVPSGTPRRTFLPYREELVGFFADVNGVSRSHHPPASVLTSRTRTN
ncbi:uncharacterized protein LOC120664536 [Panicum virgatum]|uniref:Uncharacterized protein n=1 Tax=Panicum virgatum TaxID=38727 RepID=A0A8T0U6D1_PANVG|nr:uncharacterized protein LOC120664536 [Panicum virgatum]KAG2617315.1 hypothetical protein PVAP13_3NG179983 [Panicum virgatum]